MTDTRSIKFDAYTGLGLSNVSMSDSTASYNAEAKAAGCSFVGDFSIGLEFVVLSGVGFEVNTGYRLAKTARVNITSNKGYSYQIGDPLTDFSGKALEMDFSGVTVGAGINISF